MTFHCFQLWLLPAVSIYLVTLKRSLFYKLIQSTLSTCINFNPKGVLRGLLCKEPLWFLDFSYIAHPLIFHPEGMLKKKSMAIHLLCATHDFSDFYHISPPQSLYQLKSPCLLRHLYLLLLFGLPFVFLLLTFQG